MKREERVLIKSIQRHLTPDLLSPTWKRMKTNHPLSGHCYVASEVFWHLSGGKKSNWVPCVARVDDETHWWLRSRDGTIIDPTAEQYTDCGLNPPYEVGRPCGFLTRMPSRRAQVLMSRISSDP